MVTWWELSDIVRMISLKPTPLNPVAAPALVEQVNLLITVK